MYFILKFLIISVMSADILYEHDGFCDNQTNQDQCFPYKDNFIIEKLQKIPLSEKIALINQKIPYYTNIQIKVQEIQNKGLGIILLQNINPGDILFKYKFKNIIGSQLINQKMFFQKKNTINQKHIIINKRKIKQLHQDRSKQSKFMIIINFFYHFSRLADSFLMEDLVGIPTESTMTPLYKITSYEFDLFKNNLEEIKYTIQEHRQIIFDDYKLFNKAFNKIITQEQFSYYFGKDNISFDEFLYLDYLIKTRQHQRNDDVYMFPILHYTNQATNIYNEEYVPQSSIIQNHYYFHNSNASQYNGDEFLINYQYSMIYLYALSSGFVPNIIDLHCQQIEILTENLANELGVPSTFCLNEMTITTYTLLRMQKMSQKSLVQCLTSQYKFMEQHLNDDTIVFQKKLWKACYLAGINVNFWEAPFEYIQIEKQKYINHINEIKSYIEIRIQNRKSTYIGTLILQIQEYFLQKLEDAEQNLIQFLKTNLIDD